jgi:hypothetical protein
VSRAVRGLAALALALVLVGAPAGGGAPAGAATAGEDDLIRVVPAAVEVVAPAPGHATTWSFTVTDTPATSGTAVPLVLSVTGADGPLLRGDHPLRLTVTAADGSVVIDDAELGPLLGTAVPLADLRGSTTLTASVALPAEAGDEYRGADAAVRLTVVAEQEYLSEVLAAGPDDPGGVGGTTATGGLAITGVEPIALLLAAVALLGAGGTVLLARRRRPRPAPVPVTRTDDRPATRTSEEDR